MLKPKSSNIPKPTRYQNAAIDYYMGLTNSSYLHYGYWKPISTHGEELTLTRLRVAQSAYAAKLLSFIPEGTKTVLDVGCGIGGNAVYLCVRGLGVEGLAPDALQQERFIKNTNSQVPFYLTRFEDFPTSRSYHLVLFRDFQEINY
ncbi:hypothetical protein [Nostoc sp.]|uniref:hypothetical protein n=1 Tax=Nostoc sp. TaxID=1180 RepID=UPI002FF74C62